MLFTPAEQSLAAIVNTLRQRLSLCTTHKPHMKLTSYLLTAACAAAIASAGITSASAQTASPSPSAKASPKAKASPSSSPAATASGKATGTARAVPFRGKATDVDKSAKTFTIGKLIKRTMKVTDTTKITKGGADATFRDLTADADVTGSYWKKDDGTMEVKTLKIGGATGTAKAATSGTRKSKKGDGDAAAAGGAASPSPSPSPAKK
jgi:hypothetical protein